MPVTLYGKASNRVAARYLSAAPLDDYYSMPSGRPSHTVGWGLEKKKEDLERATTYFKSRKDSWAIIIQPEKVSFDAVQDYVNRNPKLKRSKIIVVDSESLEGDDTHPDFVVIHDIIGHSIEFSAGDLLHDFSYHAKLFHSFLPYAYKIQDQDSDKAPDVLAALFFHISPKDLLDKVFRSLEQTHTGAELDELRLLFQSMVEWAALSVARWTSQFKPGVPRKVQLW